MTASLSLVAALPIRSFEDGKRRLSGVLDLPARGALIRSLAERALAAVVQSGVVDACVVVSSSPDVLMWAEARGAVALHSPFEGLNPSLDVARDWALARHASGLLIILPDLPFLTAPDIVHFVADAPSRVIRAAPDRHGTGTNLLFLRPPTLLPFQFGPNSLQRHETASRALDVQLDRISNARLAFDLDTPADLAFLDGGTGRHLSFSA